MTTQVSVAMIHGAKETRIDRNGVEWFTISVNQRDMRLALGPKVDASDALPDGRKFSDLVELKKLLLAEPDDRKGEHARGVVPAGARRAGLECLAEALDNQIEWGVWGGMTERELSDIGLNRGDIGRVFSIEHSKDLREARALLG